MCACLDQILEIGSRFSCDADCHASFSIPQRNSKQGSFSCPKCVKYNWVSSRRMCFFKRLGSCPKIEMARSLSSGGSHVLESSAPRSLRYRLKNNHSPRLTRVHCSMGSPLLMCALNCFHCRPTVWTWRALSLEFARRREGFGGMPIASFFRVVDISFEYRGDAVP